MSNVPVIFVFKTDWWKVCVLFKSWMSVQWRVRLPLWGHCLILQQHMSLQSCLFIESHISLNCASAGKYWQTIMRFVTVQVLPAVTLGAVLIPLTKTCAHMCKTKTGQGTVQVQTSNALKLGFVCVLKIETRRERREGTELFKGMLFFFHCIFPDRQSYE